MADFDELKDKAGDFVADNADKIKDGVRKVGEVIADKVGHQDLVDKAEDAVSGLVDKLSGDSAD